MAKIKETIFVVKLSQLVKDSTSIDDTNGFSELPKTIEEVVQQLVSGDVLVEVIETE